MKFTRNLALLAAYVFNYGCAGPTHHEAPSGVLDGTYLYDAAYTYNPAQGESEVGVFNNVPLVTEQWGDALTFWGVLGRLSGEDSATLRENYRGVSYGYEVDVTLSGEINLETGTIDVQAIYPEIPQANYTLVYKLTNKGPAFSDEVQASPVSELPWSSFPRDPITWFGGGLSDE